MIDFDQVWEPWKPTIGDRVKVHKQPECQWCSDLQCDRATGTVTDIDYLCDGLTEREWDEQRDPAELYIRGHHFFVTFDRAVYDTGFMEKMFARIHGYHRAEDGAFFAAIELELLEAP